MGVVRTFVEALGGLLLVAGQAPQLSVNVSAMRKFIESLARMMGEFLREAGVLVAVLAPLEWLVTHGTLTSRESLLSSS